MNPDYTLMVIGGGAAGIFAAIQFASLHPGERVVIFEAAAETLSKVRISGGGRCNVTHACFDPRELIQNYPRGSKELLGPFHKFGAAEMMSWLESKSVALKIESDGRVFPQSDKSESIIQCFQKELHQLDVACHCRSRLNHMQFNPEYKQWKVQVNEIWYSARFVFLATGSDSRTWNLLQELGHKIVSPVPSLFSMNIADPELQKLTGLSVPNARVQEKSTKINANGPLLITHWGLSGPAILKLSSRAARELADLNYQFEISVQWIPESLEQVRSALEHFKNSHPQKKIQGSTLFDLPLRLWQYLLKFSEINSERSWHELNKQHIEKLCGVICGQSLKVTGKTRFKEEFVTAGGIDLSEMDFRSFSSKKWEGLYMAGEMLNIDALTGGFNFQAAWTGAYLAAQAMSEKITHQNLS